VALSGYQQGTRPLQAHLDRAGRPLHPNAVSGARVRPKAHRSYRGCCQPRRVACDASEPILAIRIQKDTLVSRTPPESPCSRDTARTARRQHRADRGAWRRETAHSRRSRATEEQNRNKGGPQRTEIAGRERNDDAACTYENTTSPGSISHIVSQ